MLSAYRAIDFTTERGLLCGQILGDLGVDVILIEPCRGSPARKIGPYYHDREDPDLSLFWRAYNRNKRSICLDISRTEARPILAHLLGSAHFVIESFDPGYMAALGLGYESVSRMNPAIVYVSITPFGQDGPKANWKASDLTLMASAGPLMVTGDEDRPPVRTAVPQAYSFAGAEAAAAALIAHHERLRSGIGQLIDVSVQQTNTIGLGSSSLGPAAGDRTYTRVSGGVRFGPLTFRMVWPAKDGYIVINFFFGSALGPFSQRLIQWVYDEGFCDEAIRDKDWIALGQALFTGEESPEEFERIKLVIETFTRTKTRSELLAGARERHLAMLPALRIEEVLESDQLKARGFWQVISGDELPGEPLRYPGPFARFSLTPISYLRSAPRIGEHTREVLVGELGMTQGEFEDLQSCGVI